LALKLLSGWESSPETLEKPAPSVDFVGSIRKLTSYPRQNSVHTYLGNPITFGLHPSAAGIAEVNHLGFARLIPFGAHLPKSSDLKFPEEVRKASGFILRRPSFLPHGLNVENLRISEG
jgi:hypothetical protein